MKRIDINLTEFSKRTHINYDEQYYNELQKVFNDYCDYIYNLQDLSLNCKENTKNNCEKIISCIEKYYNADIVEAQEKISQILERYKNSPFIIAPIDRNYAFRGIAPKELHQPSIFSDEEIYKEMMEAEWYFFKARLDVNELHREDMLHIPFNKRSITSTQRYSIPGVPCLYLASTSYGAWREMGMPEKDVFQVSAYKIPKDLKILNLCQQPLFIAGAANFLNTDEDIRNLEDAIEILPLVMSTSFTVAEMNRNFKSEYIVSQLVMQVAKKSGIDGVAYLSKKVEDSWAYPCAVNLAILMTTDVNNGNKYWERCNEIALTKPIKYNYFLSNLLTEGDLKKAECETYVNKIYFDDCQTEINVYGNKFTYRESSFAKLDEYLVRQEFELFKENSILANIP